MTRVDDLRQQAIQAWRGLLGAKEPKRTIIPALLGDVQGTYEVPGREAFSYVRPYSLDQERLAAYNGGRIRNGAAIPVLVEIVTQPGQEPVATIIGRDYHGSPDWDEGTFPYYVAKHAETHEANPNEGDDVVNVYKRAITELRADEQATPNLTVQVQAGLWYYGTAQRYFAGGNSPAMAAPAAGYRWDLLYLTNANVLAITTGTAAGTPDLAARPDPTADTLPIAYIYLSSTTTTITDDLIYDARQLTDQVLSSSLAGHPHSGGPHTGTVIDTEVDDSSTDLAEMQATRDPYPGAAPSLAATLFEEIKSVRYLVAQITGEAQWYIDPDATIAAINALLSALEDAAYVTTEAAAGLSNEKVLGPEIVMRELAADRPMASIAGRIYVESDDPDHIVWRDSGIAPFGGFVYKKKLKFDTATISVVTSQADFPICVHINASSWSTQAERDDFFDTYNIDGKRVQFFDSDGTTSLDYEVELYDSGTPEAIYWVRVPQVDGNSNADFIWVTYGNDPYTVDQDNPTGVWNADFRTVYHLKDTAPYFQNVAGIDTGSGGHLGFSRILTIPASSVTATVVVRDHLNHHNEALTETQTLRYAYSGAADLTIWLFSDSHVGVDAGADDELIHDIDDVDTNFPAASHVLALGDLTNLGLSTEFDDYIAARATSGISLDNWYELPGNHDNLTTGDPSNFLTKLGYAEAYYSFDIDNLHFIMLGALDGSYQGGWDGALLTWLEAELSNNQDKNIIVCTHQGVYNTTSGMTNPSYYLDKVAEINLLLPEYLIDMWFYGHYHITDPIAAWVSKRRLVYDSTSNAKEAVKIAYQNPIEITDGVGQSQHFDGSDDFIRCPATDIMSVAAPDNMAVELWVKLHAQPAYNDYEEMVTLVTSPSGTVGWLTILRYHNNAGTYRLRGTIGGGAPTWADNDLTFSNNVWYHIAIVDAGGTVTVYVDGSPLGNTGATGAPFDFTTYSTGLTIGKSRHPESNQYYFWNGVEDEVRVSETNLAADWLKLEYYSILKTSFNGDSWLSWDAAEELDPGLGWFEIARSEIGTRLAQLAEKAHDSTTGRDVGDPHAQYVKESEFPDKGRILVGTGAGTFTPLVVGDDDDVLTADSLEASGVKWAVAGVGAAIEIQEDDVKVADADTVNFEGGGGKVTDEGGGKVTVDITPGAGGGLIEIQEDDAKVLDASILNFEGQVSVVDEGGGKGTVSMPAAPNDYPFAGFGTDGDLSAEVNLYDFYGKNLIKNSPGQIVTDGAEPQWWDDVANATITDEDLAGEAVAEKHKRAFKVVTIADNVYGYQTLTFADEDLLDAGETMVSLSVWVYCANAAKASAGIYGTNLGLQESSQAGAGAWTLLKVEGITLNAADTSIDVRFIVDTDTAYFTMPMLNVGPKAWPWRPRGARHVSTGLNAQLTLIPTTDVAWSDTDCTANTDPLAFMIDVVLQAQEPNGTVGSYALMSHASALAADAAMIVARVLVVGATTHTGVNGTLCCDDGQLLRYTVAEQDNDTDLNVRAWIVGYWMWE